MGKILTFFLLCGVVGTFFCCCTKNNLRQKQIVQDNVALPYFINMRGDTVRRISKTEQEWKSYLSDIEYFVLREKGTEDAFSGDLLGNNVNGIYTCRGCGMPLFFSQHKFDSKTGWVSFYKESDKTCILKTTDKKTNSKTELSCAKCGGHLGYLFKDGNTATGRRFCINSASLDYISTENKK